MSRKPAIFGGWFFAKNRLSTKKKSVWGLAI